MAAIINTNIASLNAQRNLTSSQSSLATSLQRLSTGLRINSAKDDAAGLAISDRMTSQIRGLNQAARNANDAISLAQTAEGALSEIGSNLQRIRELAVQSANATNSSSDRSALQSEASQLISEITRVAGQTQFNGINLLDGSFSSQNFQVGANSGQTIAMASIASAKSSALGSNTLTLGGTVTGSIVTAASGAVTNGMNIEAGMTIATLSGGTSSSITWAANAGADAIASAINTGASSVGITATASNSTTLSNISTAGAISFTLNGSAISATITNANDLTEIMSAINGASGSTGISASFTTSGSKNSLTLSTTDGRNINLQDYASGAGATESVSFGGTTLTEGTAISAVKTGTVSLTSTKGSFTYAGADAESFPSTSGSSAFSSVASVDISSYTGASNALAVLDGALSMISSSRADLGAYQNRFTSVVTNLQTSSENLSASRSRIQDADFAAETANLTKSQILQQAGTAMLAQANSLPQNVLSLLQG